MRSDPSQATAEVSQERQLSQELLARFQALPGLYSLVPSVAAAQRFTAQARVTLYSQQVRALNLAWALEAGCALAPGADVAVIGGGVAGLTIAAALARRGYRMLLLERAHALLPIQHSSALRFVHPRLYEWPTPGCDKEDAELPLLKWRAGSAHEVGAQILAGFMACQAAGGLVVRLGKSVRLASTEGGWQLSWGSECLTVPAVVLAVGFGAERLVAEVPFRSYWDNDNLDREPLAPGAARANRVFISGTGDGGLIDFVRARLLGFHHASTFRELLAVAGEPRLTEALLEADRTAGAQPHRLAEAYTRLALRGLTEAVDAFLRPRLHPARSAVLHGTGETPFAPGASLLNRFLTACILRLDAEGASRYDHRPLRPPVLRDGAGYRVRFTTDAPEAAGEPFDEVIIRHGVQGALAPLGPRIVDACKDLALGQEPDPTRAPAWPAGHFEPRGEERAVSAEVGGRTTASAPSPPAERPALVHRPTLASLDALLARLKLDADEIETLCLVHLPEVAREMSSGMRAGLRLQTLLRAASRDPALIDRAVAGLRATFGERMTPQAEVLLTERP